MQQFILPILVEEDLLETFVDEKAALTYRCYDAGEYELGVIVQDGSAEYTEITIKNSPARGRAAIV